MFNMNTATCAHANLTETIQNLEDTGKMICIISFGRHSSMELHRIHCKGVLNWLWKKSGVMYVFYMQVILLLSAAQADPQYKPLNKKLFP